jgi:O-glycosyl hydrolase
MLPLRISVAALALMIACLPVTTPTSAASTTIGVDGSQRFQRVDGFGVNANPKNAKYGELAPAMDVLIDQMHATLWRVDIFGKSNWIDDPSHLNASYYSVVYETPDFQALWQTLSYLNAHGAQVILSASGVVPTWMGAGGKVIDQDQEDNYVEMLVSVLDYGRRVKGIPITMLDPLNETDNGPPEGPTVWQDQFDRIMAKLVTRLSAMGYGDVELLPPEPANVANADNFMPALLADPAVMARIRHFGYHSYSGVAGDVDGWIRSSAYSDRNFWMTEWSQSATDGFLDGGAIPKDEWQFSRTMTDDLLSLLQQGAAAALAWDAWDNVHEHCGCTAMSHWGQLTWNTETDTYTPKKRFFTNAQVFAFVPAGWQRVGASASDSNLHAVAFADSGGSQLTVVGHNPNASPISVGVTLSNLESIGSMRLYLTNVSQDLVRQPDVIVSGASLAVDIPPDSFFTLTTVTL